MRHFDYYPLFNQRMTALEFEYSEHHLNRFREYESLLIEENFFMSKLIKFLRRALRFRDRASLKQTYEDLLPPHSERPPYTEM